MKKSVKIIGAGIVGCVTARGFAENGYSVQIIERRNHIAGNLYDYVDNHGIRVQKYGPHIFHTNNEKVYEFVKKYSDWEKFKLVCGAVIDGICTPTAFNFKTIDQFYDKKSGDELKLHIKNKFKDRESATVVELLDSDDELIRKYAEFLFEKDYSLYTAKQWGVSPKEIDKSVLKRVPIRFTYEEAYFKDKYECMPKEGFSKFVEEIINHPLIEVKLNEDAKEHITIEGERVLYDGDEDLIIYTGAIDELLNHRFGKLPYRSLRFEWKYEDKESFQEMPVVAYPQEKDFTRITEYKKLPVQNVQGTTYAVEYPVQYNEGDDIEPYYPVPTEDAKNLYEKYSNCAKGLKNLILLGRLAEFKYYNMDEAILRALEFVESFKFI